MLPGRQNGGRKRWRPPVRSWVVVIPDGSTGRAVNRDDRPTMNRVLSFDGFFADEYQRLARALFIVVGDPAEAEDLAQEAMVRVLERWDRVASLESPIGYLYRTALNLHRSRLRRISLGLLRRARSVPRLDPIAAADDRDELTRMLMVLPAGQREALALVEWLGMSAEDASHALGIAPVSVRVRLSRAKTTLRAGRLSIGDEATGKTDDMP
jgi:RNA polymerase sigma-70 factor (ECF subfamily)